MLGPRTRERTGTLTRKPKKPGAKKETGSHAGSAHEAAYSGAPARRSPGPFLIAAVIATAVILLGGLAVVILNGGNWFTVASPNSQAPRRSPMSAAPPAPPAIRRRRRAGTARTTSSRCSPPPRRTVLGDFNDAASSIAACFAFFRKDGKFQVETDGPDGKLAEFEIAYTFGLAPLQQYLVPFPDGRIQALTIAWDTRPKEQGRPALVPLYPDEAIGHDDVLHWTKLNQNWNFMCAECHSTGVRKNYDAAKDRSRRPGPRSASAARPAMARARPTSPGPTITRAGSRSANGDERTKGLLVRFDERDGALGRSTREPARPPRRDALALPFARRSRPADFVTRGAPRSPRMGSRPMALATPMSSRRSPTASIMPTDKWRTRPIITARSSRAGCSPRASPAAIATIPIARS